MTESLNEVASPDNFSVTIILVPKDEVELSKKRLKQTPNSNPEAIVQTVEDEVLSIESSRLRECSSYFAACMSGRWASSKVFHLELHTKPRYYQDFFARMKCPLLKPIPNITYGIQLFKVASQIEYHALMDVCEKYLAAALWSTAEESELRSLCELGVLPSYSYVCQRLRLPLTTEARKVETQSMIQRKLKGYLNKALDADRRTAELHEPRLVFANTFHMLCEEGSIKMGQVVSVHALDEIKKELVKILGEGGWESSPVRMTRDMLRFCWVFQVQREANAAQVVVELLSEHDVCKNLGSTLNSNVTNCSTSLADAARQWAKMIYFIFQDILEGRLFLNCTKAMVLFIRWIWVLHKIDLLAPGETPVSEVVVRYILSFSETCQEFLTTSWECKKPFEGNFYKLPDAHTMWTKSLVRTDRDLPDIEKAADASMGTSKNHEV